MKQGETAFGKDYFRELLERVRSIRASERRIWQQITDIYAECSIDYDKTAPTGYFDYIEDLIERENTFTMEQFAESVNEFLEFRKYDILPDKGRISHKTAEQHAFSEYDIFNRTQIISSDFDKEIKKLTEAKSNS